MKFLKGGVFDVYDDSVIETQGISINERIMRDHYH